MLIIPFSLKISKSNLKSILENMERIQPLLPEKELFMDVQAELVPDGLSYEVTKAELFIIAEGMDEPLESYETVALKEITK